MDIFTPFSYVSLFFLCPRPVATFFSFLPLRPCHRTPTLAAPFDLALTVALQYYIHSLLLIWIPDPFCGRHHAIWHWQDPPFRLRIPFPPISLSLRSIHC